MGAFIAGIVLQPLSYMTKVERDGIRQRQREGADAAMACGVRLGRPKKARPENCPQVRDAYLNGFATKCDAAKDLGVCVNASPAWLDEDDEPAAA